MDMAGFYRRYIAVCNAHRFAELGEFVADDVRINDAAAGLDQYAAGLRDVVAAFPDYHWDLHQLLVDGDCLAARLTGTGTHTGRFLGVPATGQAISTRELAMYRIANGKIVECWGDLGSSVRDRLTWGPT